MEKDFEPFDWVRIVIGEQPPAYMLEVALKCLLIFLLLLVVMRMMGKRGQANLSPMQQMLLIALGSAAGDALLYPKVALAYAVIVLLGVTGLTVGLDWLGQRSRWVRNRVESHPRLLVRDGVVDLEALRKERTSERELHAALRVNGARSMSQVQYAILEVDGEISVFLTDAKPAEDDLIAPIVAAAERERRADGRVLPHSL